MKTHITKHTKKEMGLKIIDGEYVDKYGRILEVFKDAKGYEDLKPTGRVCRNMRKYNSNGEGL